MGMLIRGLAVIAALITLVQHGPAAADEYPSRPLTLIAPWPAGGAVDTLCRIFAARLTDRLGKSGVVDNRPRAGSVLGGAATARAAPGGDTLVMAGRAARGAAGTISESCLTTRARTLHRWRSSHALHSCWWSIHLCR